MHILSSLALIAAHRRRFRRRRRPERAREEARLRAHFREVLSELSARDLSQLDADQRAMRGALIAELERYARAGRYPRNLDFPGRQTPYFVDAFGTRCAVAHLIEATGGGALVAEIAGTMNNALVSEMAHSLALRAWIERAGLTPVEVARIQPSYCFMSKAEACLCNQAISPAGVLEVTVVSKLSSSQVMARVDVIYGSSGGTMVGQEIMLYQQPVELYTVLLVQVDLFHMMTSLGRARPVREDGTVQVDCELDVPPLTKHDAIAAILARQDMSQRGVEACAAQLGLLDCKWSESACKGKGGERYDPFGDRGCTTAASSGGSPFLLGTALAFATLWSWRRRRSAS